jgi:hypothetical protein
MPHYIPRGQNCTKLVNKVCMLIPSLAVLRACPMALGPSLGPELQVAEPDWIFKKGANGAIKRLLNLQSPP